MYLQKVAICLVLCRTGGNSCSKHQAEREHCLSPTAALPAAAYALHPLSALGVVPKHAFAGT